MPVGEGGDGIFGAGVGEWLAGGLSPWGSAQEVKNARMTTAEYKKTLLIIWFIMGNLMLMERWK